MNLRLQFDITDIDWDSVVDILRTVGMANYSPELHKQAFANSHNVVFIFENKRLIGFGRAISDGAYQAAIYDVAVVPDCQGKGVGRIIVDQIMRKCPDCNFILYAAPGKELFYEKQNFRKMKSGMAFFVNAEQMKLKGFTE